MGEKKSKIGSSLPMKLNTNITAMDTTQDRVILHDVGNIQEISLSISISLSHLSLSFLLHY